MKIMQRMVLPVFFLLFWGSFTNQFPFAQAVVEEEGEWSDGIPMNEALFLSGSVVIDKKIYLFTTYSLGIKGRILEFDSVNITWRTLGEIPTDRHHYAIGAINGKIFLAGGVYYDYANGGKGTVLDIVEMYDPNNNTWSTKASIPTVVYGAASAVINNRLYVIGGYNTSNVYIYNASTNSWNRGASMPTVRNSPGVTVVNGIIYVIGGGYYGRDNGIIPVVEIYNPISNSWSTGKPMPTARFAPVAVNANGKIYVIGGFTYSTAIGGQVQDIVEVYDPYANTWTSSAALPTKRSQFSASVINNKIYVIGGRIGSECYTLSEIYEFEPEDQTPNSILSGQVTDIYGNPIAEVVVEAQTFSEVTSSNHLYDANTLTDSKGNFNLQLSSGQFLVTVSKAGYEFDQSLQTVMVPSTQSLIFVGQDQSALVIQVPLPEPVPLPSTGYKPVGYDSSKIPLLLVHGWQLGGGYSCSASEGPYLYEEIKSNGNVPLGEMPQWFQSDGRFDVWIAYLTTSYGGTDTFEENAECLREQVVRLSNYYDQKIKIVAHSMGGLVSRACISNPECGSRVDSLSTMGSPHGGIEPQTLIALLGIAWSEGTGGFHPDEIVKFNLRNRNRAGVKYHFIAGDANSVGLKIVDFILVTRDTINDGLVDTSSAHGFDRAWHGVNLPSWWSASKPGISSTDEAHISSWGNSYYSRDDGLSRSYHCILLHIFNEVDINFEKCTGGAVRAAQVIAESQSVPIVYSPVITGVIESGQIITRQVPVDSSESAVFYMSWQSGIVTQTLITPSGQKVVPNVGNTYVALDGGNEMLPFSAYSMTVTQPGTWGIRITAGEIPGGATAYTAFVAMESQRTLDVSTDCEEASCVITATLKSTNGYISGADIQAVVGDSLVVNLTETLPGIYAANTILNMEGRVLVTVRAKGIVEEEVFKREAIDFLEIVPEALSVTRIDSHEYSNSSLNFSVNLQVAKPSTYTLYIQTHDTEGLVSLASRTVYLEEGLQKIVLNDGGGDYSAGAQLSVSLDVVKYESGQTVISAEDIYELTIPQAEEEKSNAYLPLITR
jgi:N-acetylneuraminic acid mutarotase/pimeloyl-ACP methyl ester carboxylesterase